MNINASGFLEQALHFVEASVEPDEVAGHPALPDVRERAQLILVAEDDVVLPPGEERGVNVYEVNTFRGELAHYMEIVAPEEAIWFEFGMAEGDTFDYLERQINGGEQLAEAFAAVPTQRLLLDRYAAEAYWWPPKLFLL